MKRLFVFDMDGTLLPHTTGMLQIAKNTGHTPELKLLEKQLSNKEIENHQFSERLYELWSDLGQEVVKQSFMDSPKIQNIERTLENIYEIGCAACLITSAPYFFAKHFYDYGFKYIFASKVFDLDQREYKPENCIQAQDKPILAKHLCKQLNLHFDDTVAFGDSLSDVSLFQALKHTISVNGDHHIKEYAKHHYQGLDLLEAFEIITGDQILTPV